MTPNDLKRLWLSALCLPALAFAQEPRLDPSWQRRGQQDLESFLRTGEHPEPGDPPCLPENPNRVHATRHVTLSEDAADKVLEVYVARSVATILRLPSQMSMRRTSLAPGAEGRFQLVMGSDKILITPTTQLARGERFSMLVALADGTVIPLSLTGAPVGGRTDGELWLDRDRAKPEELRLRLVSMTEKAIGFEASLRQALKEQESEDYALAELMAADHGRLTAFDRERERLLVNDSSRTVELLTYAPRPDAAAATSKVVAVVVVTNKGQEPLDFASGRAIGSPGAEFVPIALRASPSVIPPGLVGHIAVVLDRVSFGPDGSGKVTLELYAKRGDAGIQLSSDLMLEDFAAPAKTGLWRWFK